MPNRTKNLEIIPEVTCRREVRERIVAALCGKRKHRRLGCVAADVTNPMGEPLKLTRTLKEQRVGFLASWRIAIAPQAKSLAAMHGKLFDTGEFDPPPTKKAA